MKNTLKYSKMLESVGLSREQAEVHLNVMEQAMYDNVATKIDINLLRAATKADLNEHRAATKDDIKASINELREETKTSINELREETKTSINELREETRVSINELRKNTNELKLELSAFKADMKEFKAEAMARFENLEHKITIRLGGLVLASTTGLAAFIKFFT